ncbi:hypothetical protein Patl1_04349 [Pistacia atlantica]|uniref:Uncharacterized protein n=1 Tax=Pistacia atlantica TaxID=434234 RepID=A0ACC1BVE9_9ROSI|nr:hypothetical protein Patl1_04349 [Pistacia atlantica]
MELSDPTHRPNALHLAVLNNTTHNVREFLHLQEMKELVNEHDVEGDTPLHLAIKNENYKMVKKLMATECVDLRTKNNKGLTALDICESDWNLSYRQNSLHTYLRGQNAPRVVFLLILAMVGDPAFLHSAIFYSKNLLNIALFGTLVAFVTGLYTLISPKSEWLAIIVVVICSSVPFLIKFLHRKSSTSNPLVIKYLKGTMKKPVITYSPEEGVQILVMDTRKPNHLTGTNLFDIITQDHSVFLF